MSSYSTELVFQTRRECTSTQDEARAWLRDGNTSPMAVVAARQTAGRGRDGRTWSNPPGAALMMSIAIPGPLAIDRLEGLPERVAGVVAGSLCALGAPVAVKLPNDLMADGAKVGGVLIDAQTEGEVLRWLAVGIGINLAGDPFDVDGVPATTVTAAGGSLIERDLLAERIARAVIARVCD